MRGGWMRSGRRLGTVVAVSLLLEGLPAAEAERTAVEGLDRWLSGTRTLECRFDQRLVSSALGATARESGTLYVERPGRLRWDYLEPERKMVLVDGERTVLHLVEDGQWIRGRLSDEQKLIPELLAGRGSIEALFAASELGRDSEGGGPRVKLVRHGSPDGFEEILLTLRERDFAIERAEVLDAAGSRVEYRFSAIQRNRGIAPGVFAAEPPVGVEVVGEP